jgi:predicted Zn-dependent peptidase
MECEVFRLDNGLRIAFQEDRSIHTIHCGFMINAGSRDETQEEHGLAHLIEHGLFKGTEKRKAFHVLSRLDSVGGEINAYTTKEETCIYASALKEHFLRAAELTMDIVFAASFPQKELNKEVGVIKDEINGYKDAPDEMLMDEFEERLFPNHALGRNILGSESGVSNLKRDQLLNFVERMYSTDEIVFACVGNISKRRFLTFCENALSKIPMRNRLNAKRSLPTIESFDVELKKTVHQTHTIIGGTTVGMNHDNSKSMTLLNNILGGPALNSQLNLNIRERFGYCYYIESGYTAYSDIGLFQIYFGTDPQHQKKILKLVRKEMDKLSASKMSDRALIASKKQLLGQLALGQEQRSSLMISNAKSLLHFNKVDAYSQMDGKVMSITAESLRETAETVFAPSNMSRLAYIP